MPIAELDDLDIDLEDDVLRPQDGPQEAFFETDVDICVFGGGAGGGKSWGLLVEPLRYLTGPRAVPGFGGVIFRRTMPEITNEGGLWDEACEVYPHFGGIPRIGDREFRFPPYGNTISFRHLEHEKTKYNWQGAQICYIAFDELAHFTQSQFWYLISRNRSMCGVSPYVRATCNPDPGWLKEFLAPWVDKEYPGDKALSCEPRWFVRDGGEIRWVPPGTPDAKSLTFIRASVYDNKILLRKNPEYIPNLKALPPVERARLHDGDWDVRREGIVYAGFEQCLVESGPDAFPTGGGMDYGFNNPYACLWGHVDHDDVMWVTGCRYQRQTTIPVHAEAIPRGPRYYSDPAQPESTAQLRALGHDVIPCVHRPARGASGETKKPILAGIDMVSERMRTGRLKIVRPACLPLVRELGLYQYDPTKASEDPVDADNHACDALRYWVVGHDRNREPNKVQAAAIAEAERLRAAREERAERDRKAALDELAELQRANPMDPRFWTQG